jgi:hypothetical protein
MGSYPSSPNDDEGNDEDSEPRGSPGRPLTIDDVPRLGSGTGIAIGCGVAVLVAVVLFWLVRGWLLRLP